MSTSKLQRRVSELLLVHLGQYTIRENSRPDWLITPEGARLELDFYIKELEVAIEVQGIQHYVYVPHFHQDHDNFLQRLKWDIFKRETCISHGVHFIEIDNEEDAKLAIWDIVKAIQKEIPQEIDKSEFYVINTKNVKQHREPKPFGYYDKTVKKHLRRLFGILQSHDSFTDVSEREHRWIDIHIRAIEQYASAKNLEIDFDEHANRVLRVARECMEARQCTLTP